MMSDNRWLFNTVESSVHSTIRKLDQILCQLNGFTPILEQSARHAANEIKLNFDAIFETLSEQKLKLMRQLDQVIREKNNNISSERQAVEAIRNALITYTSNGLELDSQIRECIAKAESITVSPKSIPFVSFRNNISLLDRAIMNYGQIISRYCGHFADPSLPSTCLPLEVEEEDDNDHVAIGRQGTGHCSCVDPSIRQWLLNPTHKCSSKNTTCSSLRRKKVIASQNADIADNIYHYLANNRQLSTGSSHLTKPCDIHTWLDQAQQPTSSSYTRKVSESFTTVDSDHAESFVALNESSGTSVNLKEWLFSDPMDTDDIPGLSNMGYTALPEVKSSVQCLASPAADIEDLSKWLMPPPPTTNNSTLSANVRINPRGSAIPTREGHADVVCVSNPQHEDESNVLHATETPLTSGGGEISTEGGQSATVTEKQAGDYDCIYSQCCGGPGGPTCCGGRPRRPQSDSSPACQEPISGEVTSDARLSSSADQVIRADASPAGDNNRLSATGRAVVDQLTSIANSHWRQWLIADNNRTPSLKRSFKEEQYELLDNSRWLATADSTQPSGPKQIDKAADPSDVAWQDLALKKQIDQLPGADYEGWLATKLLTCVSTGQTAVVAAK